MAYYCYYLRLTPILYSPLIFAMHISGNGVYAYQSYFSEQVSKSTSQTSSTLSYSSTQPFFELSIKTSKRQDINFDIDIPIADTQFEAISKYLDIHPIGDAFISFEDVFSAKSSLKVSTTLGLNISKSFEQGYLGLSSQRYTVESELQLGGENATIYIGGVGVC